MSICRVQGRPRGGYLVGIRIGDPPQQPVPCMTLPEMVRGLEPILLISEAAYV